MTCHLALKPSPQVGGGGLLDQNLTEYRWVAEGLKPCHSSGQIFLKYVSCLGQNPQFYYPV